MNQLEAYTDIIKIRDLLKRIQQISWNINQFEKRYPLDQVEDSDFPLLLNTYKKFFKDILTVSNDMNQYEHTPHKNT